MAEFLRRCEVIEKCCGYLLAYAGQGTPSAADGEPGGLRELLDGAAGALTGLAQVGATAVRTSGLRAKEPYAAFFDCLERDARASLSSIEGVLAAPGIQNHAVEQLRGSVHLRALVTDVCLFREVVGGVDYSE